MKNKMLTKTKRKLKKSGFMHEMAEDMMDILKKAKKLIKK